MKIALIGYGKMGKLIEQKALEAGHIITGKICSKDEPKKLDSQAILNADVCIDFSHPSSALSNIQEVAKLKRNLVMGTTGWYNHLHEVEKIVQENGIGFLYAPNFSIGVNLFLEIVEQAAIYINKHPEYDVGGHEAHHNQKADFPSGTAKAIAERLLANLSRKSKIVYELEDRKLEPDELHYGGLRCGFIPGTHSVVFDSPADTITMTHQARNRDGFALGAIKAGEWLKGKRGFFTIQDMLNNSKSR